MKSIVKKLFLILVILIILFSLNTKVFAMSEIISDAQGFLQKADQSKANIEVSGLQDLSGYIYNILLSIGVVVSVIVATMLGVQFMLGGAEGQAKVKEMLIPFVVGCVIVFGGFGFWKLAITFGEKLEGSSSSVAPGGGGSSSGNEGSSGGDNHYDFSERACKSCGQVIVPRYDEYKHTYVCPKCGKSPDVSTNNNYDFSERACRACGQAVEPRYDEYKHTYVCPKCGNTMQ